jgi:phospho-N-acetylmuramoyl-pentapeptide-transferase
MPKFIRWAKNKKVSQPIFTLAPDTHKAKAHTPTMGGLVFTVSSLLAVFFSAKLNNVYVIGAVLTIILFASIGIKDDLSKILGKCNQAGLSPRMKLVLQVLSSVIVGAFLYFFTDVTSQFFVPFYKFALVDMKYFVLIFWALVIIATSNAVNLTDGLDGLATVPSIFSLFTLGVFIYISGHAILSNYLFLPSISGVGEASIVAASMIGALIGFLWHNCHPAEVFMGDSGSLTLGALIAYFAIISKNEILLVLIGFVFVLETVSVILQVGSYKTRKKRIFKMAPIHHHFEIKGWAENKIIVRFWIIAFLANVLALATIKIR